MAELTISCGRNRVRLAPEAGGGIAAFLCHGREVLRSASPQAVAARDPLGLACFAMTPFVNRVRDGRFVFNEREVGLSQPGVRHPLHGQGWRRAWTIEQATPDSAVLALAGGGDDWPWRYLSRQTFAVSEAGLDVALTVENLSLEPMPASLGLHPYFPDLARARLKAETSGLWETDDTLVPTRWCSHPNASPFASHTPLAGTDLDTCFTGFGGEAVISWPDRPSVRLVSQGCAFLQVYTRGDDDAFCVEAQTAMPDALNRLDDPGAGTAVLQAGKSLACLTRFLVDDDY